MTKWRNKSNCNIVTQRYKRLPHFNTRSLEQLKREGKHTSTLWTQRTIMAPDFFRDVKCILQLLSCQPGDLGEGPDLHWTDSWGKNWGTGNSSIVVEFYKAKLWNMCEWDYQVGRAKSSKESLRWTVGKLDWKNSRTDRKTSIFIDSLRIDFVRTYYRLLHFLNYRICEVVSPHATVSMLQLKTLNTSIVYIQSKRTRMYSGLYPLDLC